jgi:hypothetical protein
MSGSATQPVWNPTDVVASSSQTQSGSSQATEPLGNQHLYTRPTQTFDQISTASSSSQLLRQNSPPAHSNEANIYSGFFAGASRVDARDGVFIDVAGNLVINVEGDMKVCFEVFEQSNNC